MAEISGGEEQKPVYIIDDDRDVRASISFMLRASGIPTRPFARGRDFLDALAELDPGVILLDIRMPDMDGMEVLRELSRRSIGWPSVIMTGHGEVALAVQAMKLGAVDFIEKPFEEPTLQVALDRACEILTREASGIERRRQAKDMVERLSRRERQVLECLVEGLPNKLIAQRLGISLRTAEMHRGNLMRHLGADSLADVLKLAGDAGVAPALSA